MGSSVAPLPPQPLCPDRRANPAYGLAILYKLHLFGYSSESGATPRSRTGPEHPWAQSGMSTLRLRLLYLTARILVQYEYDARPTTGPLNSRSRAAHDEFISPLFVEDVEISRTCFPGPNDTSEVDPRYSGHCGHASCIVVIPHVVRPPAPALHPHRSGRIGKTSAIPDRFVPHTFSSSAMTGMLLFRVRSD